MESQSGSRRRKKTRMGIMSIRLAELDPITGLLGRDSGRRPFKRGPTISASRSAPEERRTKTYKPTGAATSRLRSAARRDTGGRRATKKDLIAKRPYAAKKTFLFSVVPYVSAGPPGGVLPYSTLLEHEGPTLSFMERPLRRKQKQMPLRSAAESTG